jgi:hypothetical protein
VGFINAILRQIVSGFWNLAEDCIDKALLFLSGYGSEIVVRIGFHV